MQRILVLGTGGTIAGREVTPGSTAYRSGQVEVADLLPDLAARDIAVTTEQIANVGSQDMDAVIWRKLRARILDVFATDAADAVVITHGTDTLEETGFWLDLTVADDRPVVLTGAMRPAGALGNDGPRNLACALRVAQDAGSLGRGVLAVMGDRIFAARHLAKAATDSTQAFTSYPAGCLGTVAPDRVTYHGPAVAPVLRGRFDPPEDEPPQVGVLMVHADMDLAIVNAVLNAGLQGIVLAGVGHGNAPRDVLKCLAGAATEGLAVVRSSRIGTATVLRNTEVDDDGSAFIAGGPLNPAKSRILLQMCLAAGLSDPAAIQGIFDHF